MDISIYIHFLMTLDPALRDFTRACFFYCVWNYSIISGHNSPFPSFHICFW